MRMVVETSYEYPYPLGLHQNYLFRGEREISILTLLQSLDYTNIQISYSTSTPIAKPTIVISDTSFTYDNMWTYIMQYLDA